MDFPAEIYGSAAALGDGEETFLAGLKVPYRRREGRVLERLLRSGQ